MKYISAVTGGTPMCYNTMATSTPIFSILPQPILTKLTHVCTFIVPYNIHPLPAPQLPSFLNPY